MIDALFSLAIACYGLSSALFLAYLSGASKQRAPGTVPLVALAAGLHIAHDVLYWARAGVGPFAGIRPALSFLALLVVGTYLLVRALRKSVEAVGAFVTPLALLMLLGSRAAARSPMSTSALLAAHIASNLVGVAAFTVAFAMAMAYLLQERQVKARHLGTLFHRLPPLETLDTLGFRCIAVGMPAMTIGVVTGHIVAARAHLTSMPWQQYFAMISWALFAAVLLLRFLAGWRGRRAAIGTILGYASALLVLLFYSVGAGNA